MDGDGDVDAVDALFVLRYVVGLSPFAEYIDVGDVNCDGSVDAVDALGILRHVVGLSPIAGAPGCPPIGTPGLNILTVDKFGAGTVVSSPEGIDCGADCTSQSRAFLSGSTVVLAATPDAGSTFSHWSGCDVAVGSSCTVTLDADRTVLTTFALTEAEIPPTTKVLDEGTMQHLLRQDDGSYCFDPQAEAVADIQPGDVIVSQVDGGLLREVTAVDVSDQEICLQTDDATLEDAIQRGTLVFTDERPTGAGVQSVRLAGFESASLGGAVSCNIAQVRCAIEFDSELDAGTRLRGNTSFDVDLDIDATVDWYMVREARAAATLTGQFDLSLLVGSGFSLSKELSIPLGKAVWIGAIGPVPVVLDVDLSLKLGITGNADAGMESGVTWAGSVTTGMRYVRGSGWTFIKNLSGDFGFSEPSLALGASEVQGYVKPVLNMTIQKVPGTYFGAKGFLRLEADPRETPWWSLYGGVGAEAGFVAKVFGWTIVDFRVPLWEREWLLTQAATPPPTPCAPNPIGLVDTVIGSLSATDCWSTQRGVLYYADRYSFSGAAGQQVSIAYTSSGYDPSLYLIGPDGSVVAQAHFAWGNDTARIPSGSGFFTLPVSGTYIIEVTSYDTQRTGTYTLRTSDPTGGCGSPTPVGSNSARWWPWLDSSQSRLGGAPLSALLCRLRSGACRSNCLSGRQVPRRGHSQWSSTQHEWKIPMSAISQFE